MILCVVLCGWLDGWVATYKTIHQTSNNNNNNNDQNSFAAGVSISLCDEECGGIVSPRAFGQQMKDGCAGDMMMLLAANGWQATPFEFVRSAHFCSEYETLLSWGFVCQPFFDSICRRWSANLYHLLNCVVLICVENMEKMKSKILIM